MADGFAAHTGTPAAGASAAIAARLSSGEVTTTASGSVRTRGHRARDGT
ncbi:hypothetical protein ACFU93_17375 [Streptomyces sp. NPDC057611]